MKLINEPLDYKRQRHEKEVVLFTSNSSVRRDGGLVMGRGSALQVRTLWPEGAYEFGDLVIQHGDHYGLLFYPRIHPLWNVIGAFQTKESWMRPAEINLIVCAVELLAERAGKNPDFTIHMPFPGVGNGQLCVDHVIPEIQVLPDNVLVYLVPEAHPGGLK